ncbi:MAG TPA: glycerol-3-phosphate acyltransferase, partial [Dehalococcoidales bacterium]
MPVIIAILSYLIGSIPFAYVVGRLVKGIDIRKVGDGNVGGANAFREIGAAAGLFVIVADIMKGVTAVLIAQGAHLNQTSVFVAGFACVLGHIYPVFLNFKGGRGEATAEGVLVVLLPVPMLTLLAIGLIPVILTRNTLILGAILFAPL